MCQNVVVLASLCLLSAAVSARLHDIRPSVLLTSAMLPAKAAPAVKAPDTPAGRALGEFVHSFNAGSKTRQRWQETRTTIGEDRAPTLSRMTPWMLQKYGPLTVVRIVRSSPEFVAAVVRHGSSNIHGCLTIAVEPSAPFKVVDFAMRAATSEECKGGGGKGD